MLPRHVRVALLRGVEPCLPAFVAPVLPAPARDVVAPADLLDGEVAVGTGNDPQPGELVALRTLVPAAAQHAELSPAPRLPAFARAARWNLEELHWVVGAECNKMGMRPNR